MPGHRFTRSLIAGLHRPRFIEQARRQGCNIPRQHLPRRIGQEVKR